MRRYCEDQLTYVLYNLGWLAKANLWKGRRFKVKSVMEKAEKLRKIR